MSTNQCNCCLSLFSCILVLFELWFDHVVYEPRDSFTYISITFVIRRVLVAVDLTLAVFYISQMQNKSIKYVNIYQ